MSGSTDVLEVMLQHGADFDAINEEGCTPLFSACQCNNQFATSILLEHGADVRMKNLQGEIGLGLPCKVTNNRLFE